MKILNAAIVIEENEQGYTVEVGKDHTYDVIVFESDQFEGVRAVLPEVNFITGHGSLPDQAIRDLLRQVDEMQSIDDPFEAASPDRPAIVAEDVTAPDGTLKQPVAAILGGHAVLYPPLVTSHVNRPFWAAVHCNKPFTGFGDTPQQAKDNLLENMENMENMDRIRPIADLAALHDLVEGAMVAVMSNKMAGDGEFNPYTLSGMLGTLCWILGHGSNEERITEMIKTKIKPLATMSGAKEVFTIFGNPYPLERLDLPFQAAPKKRGH